MTKKRRGGARTGAGRKSAWKLGQTSVIRVPKVFASKIANFARKVDACALHEQDAIALIEKAIAFIEAETEIDF